jgi:Undecaprenyl-phosphate glucose phosphotransferase
MYGRAESSEVRAEPFVLRAVSPPVQHLRLDAVNLKILLLEFLAVATAAYLASALFQYTTLQMLPAASQYVPAALFIASLVLMISVGFRHFAAIRRQPPHMLLWNGVGAVALAFSLFLTTLFLIKGAEAYSRGAFIFQVVAVTCAVCFTRTAFYFWLQRAIRSGQIAARHVVLVGGESARAQFSELVRTAGIRSVGSLPFPFHQKAETAAVGSLVDIQSARQLVSACRLFNPDDIVILASHDEFSAAPEVARILSELPVNVHIVPVGSINIYGTSRIGELGDLKTLEVSRPPLSLFDRAIKRGFDLIVATAGLILLAPLFVIVAIAIRLETRGKVLYWQERHGYNNTVIRVAKFRSMVSNADENGFVQARLGDARVTHVGRILRRTSIDELPQLLNVLMGEMSIVGPRPHATAHNAMFEGRILPFSRRHNIKPGITGWAQVNGHRGETDTLEKMQRRVEHDLYYIDNWSILLDLKIVLLTLLSRRAYINAY